jgi:hypothetical protein
VKTHRFDPISLLLGIVTVIVGLAAINSRLGRLINDRPDSLIPLLVLAVGLVAVVVATRRSLPPPSLPTRSGPGVDGSLQDVDGAGDDQHDSAE